MTKIVLPVRAILAFDIYMKKRLIEKIIDDVIPENNASDSKQK